MSNSTKSLIVNSIEKLKATLLIPTIASAWQFHEGSDLANA
ncbi:MAG: hypothetical protein V7K32_23550 [Nostoc sp.]